VLILFLLVIFLPYARAQCIDKKNPNGLSWDFDEGKSEGFSIGSVFSEIFIPQIIIDTKHIRHIYSMSGFRFCGINMAICGTIDAIYLKSLKIADYNIARALFLSFLAVLEHHTVDFKMPISVR